MGPINVSRVVRQLRALPIRLKLWLAWLILSTLVVPLIFVSHEFFAAFMVCQAANLVFGSWLMLRFGLVKLLSLAHILFWTPMIGKFIWFYETLNGFDLFVAYGVILTVFISLIIDFKDYRSWCRGDREPIV